MPKPMPREEPVTKGGAPGEGKGGGGDGRSRVHGAKSEGAAF